VIEFDRVRFLVRSNWLVVLDDLRMKEDIKLSFK
jgi:hypothetical protein